MIAHARLPTRIDAPLPGLRPTARTSNLSDQLSRQHALQRNLRDAPASGLTDSLRPTARDDRPARGEAHPLRMIRPLLPVVAATREPWRRAAPGAGEITCSTSVTGHRQRSLTRPAGRLGNAGFGVPEHRRQEGVSMLRGVLFRSRARAHDAHTTRKRPRPRASVDHDANPTPRGAHRRPRGPAAKNAVGGHGSVAARSCVCGAGRVVAPTDAQPHVLRRDNRAHLLRPRTWLRMRLEGSRPLAT
jgi:hypothetical protein